MKKLILLLIVISATALEAQNYQYFTAKQGIPKAMEIAKAYFNNDSVSLYEIMCIRYGMDSLFGKYSIEDINPYNDTTGKSIFWYYKICDITDSCLYIRIRKLDNIFFQDTIWEFNLSDYDDKRSLIVDSILIDSDSLVKCFENCYSYIRDILIFLKLSNTYIFNLCPFDSIPVWWDSEGSYLTFGAFGFYINSKSGKCCEWSLELPEHKELISYFTIISDPNTDNIIIELNSDLFHDAELRLYDQVGVLHFADKFNNKSYELSTYNYPSGLYILQIKYGGNVITKTVMIVH